MLSKKNKVTVKIYYELDDNINDTMDYNYSDMSFIQNYQMSQKLQNCTNDIFEY